MTDNNGSKYTAIKVDVTSLHSSLRKRHDKTTVAVVSSVTSASDVIHTVASRIGIDVRQVPSLQLVAQINNRQRRSFGRHGDVVDVLLSDDDIPLVVYNVFQKQYVSFHIRWKSETDVISNTSLTHRLQEMMLAENAVSSSYQLAPSSVKQLNQPATLPRASFPPSTNAMKTADLRNQLVASQQQQGNIYASSNDITRPRGIERGSSNRTAMTSFTSSSNVGQPAGECLIHYEPVGSLSLSTDALSRLKSQTSTSKLQVAKGIRVGPENPDIVNCAILSNGKKSSNSRQSGKPDLQPSSKWHHVSGQGNTANFQQNGANKKTNSADVRKSYGQDGGSSISTAFKTYTDLAAACNAGTDEEDDQTTTTTTGDSDCEVRSRGGYSADQRSTRDQSFDLQRQPSGGKHQTDGVGSQLVKYTSLPNIDKLKPFRRRWKHTSKSIATKVPEQSSSVVSDIRRSSGEPSAGSVKGTDVGRRSSGVGQLSSVSSSSTHYSSTTDGIYSNRGGSYLERSSTLPCISSACAQQGRGQTPKRFLPSLTIPEEAVEMKRLSLSRLLSERLLKAADRQHSLNNLRRGSTGSSGSSGRGGGGGASSAANHSVRAPPTSIAQHLRRYPPAVLDDDAMSVTSQEVAEILSTAAPMAPVSDEEDYEEPPETDGDYSSGEESEQRATTSSATSSLPVQQRLSNESFVNPAKTGFTWAQNQVRGYQSTTGLNAHTVADLPLKSAQNNSKTVSNIKDQSVVSAKVVAGNTQSDFPSLTGSSLLFQLFTTYSLHAVRLKCRFRSSGDESAVGRLQTPVQLVDVADETLFNQLQRLYQPVPTKSTAVKFDLAMVSKVTAEITSEQPISENYIRRGDIVVEVSGRPVVGQSASSVHQLLVAAACDRSKRTTIDVIVARRLAPSVDRSTSAIRVRL